MISLFFYHRISGTIEIILRMPGGYMTEKQKKWIAGAGILLFLLLSGFVFWFAGKPLIRFVSEPERFRSWVDTHGIWGRAAFLGMVVLQILVAVIPGEPLEIAAGYAFGFWEGTFLCILGTTLGGILVFAFVRRWGIHVVEIFFPREKIEGLRFLQNEKRVFWTMAVVFLLPGTPKDILSYFAGLTKIRFSHWLLITSFCRLPSIVTSTIGGDTLVTGTLYQAALIFGITICLSLTGLAIWRSIRKQHEKSR